MLMPLEHLRAILELLFREGVLVAEKDPRPRRPHPQLPGVANVEVLRAMASLRSRRLVRETFAWRHFYWYLTDDGVAYLRRYLRLPPEIVPLSLQRPRRPAEPPRRPLDASGPGRARVPPAERLYRRKDEAERHAEPVAAAGGASRLPPQPGSAPGIDRRDGEGGGHTHTTPPDWLGGGGGSPALVPPRVLSWGGWGAP
uniref:Plectin/eS10 N-terminal domain-containing protein n=1 Tax=Otus sunia TaxID=257818 RepID=A0A8C8B3U1_9STRI